jgi:hypothetical protein
LQRFAKSQLASASASEKAAIEADIARYQSYLDADLKTLHEEVAADTAAKAALVPLVDRYPDVPIEKLPEYCDILEAKMKAAFDILEKQVAPPMDIDEGYFETSKFQVLNVNSGSIVTLPEGPIVPGAVECLEGQIIHTVVNGEEVMLEIDEIEEDYMVCWFKPEIPIPEGAEVLWDYPYEPTAVTPTGTKWDAKEVAITAVPEIEWDAVTQPPVKVVNNPYASMAVKMEQKNGAELKAQFKMALFNPSALLPLDSDYATTYDREVVESKRDRYMDALVKESSVKYELPDVTQLMLEHNILKSKLVDFLRAQEFQIAGQQLLARIHERRLAGEVITQMEEMDYSPFVRDDAELATDYADPTMGRYIWKLFPHCDGDEDALCKDTRFEHEPEDVDPLNAILADHLAASPAYAKLEKKLFTQVAAA